MFAIRVSNRTHFQFSPSRSLKITEPNIGGRDIDLILLLNTKGETNIIILKRGYHFRVFHVIKSVS